MSDRKSIERYSYLEVSEVNRTAYNGAWCPSDEVRELESYILELEKKFEIAIDTFEALKSCIENPLTKYPEIVGYAMEEIEKALVEIKGDQNEV